MTDFELADLLVSHLEALLGFLTAFVSLTSAFLVAAFFGEGRLSKLLARLTAGIYSLAAIFFIFVTQRIGSIMAGIQAQMGESLAWHPAAYEPESILLVTRWFLVFAMTCAYLFSMWYFFRHIKPGAADEDRANA